ncbi:MAG TPA: glycerate kinase [Anaerolineales bacterium]|nr:glycerate kinase [Anaerolineales bacterium]
MELNRFATHSLQDVRLMRALAAALEAVDPFKAVQRHLPHSIEGRVFGLGIGKAAIPMMDALAGQIQLSGGLAVTKFASGLSRRPYSVIEGGHPVPDARSLQAGERVLEFVTSLKEEDTLVCLISGGGSALVTAPYVPLKDLQTLTNLLLASGARIGEINTLRRQLDRLKGGGLARASKAKIISLILSDVIGNPLEAIASGPTAPDPTTKEDALGILEKYFPSLAPETQRGVDSFSLDAVTQWLRGTKKRETLKPDNPIFARVQNIIVGDNKLAAQAALKQAEDEGFYAQILSNELQGEARQVGHELAQRLRIESSGRPAPFCLIAGGETTVTLRGKGKGGRNQELALAAVTELADLKDVVLIALATDGDDGPTDAAGAVVTGETAQRAESLGLDAASHLSRNDAYPFFEALGDLLMTGPTGTNVNDLIFLFAL